MNDAVAFAAQTGRLDFVSALLAIIAIILGASAIPVFLVLKARAEKVARATVAELTDELVKKVEQEAISKVEAMLPTLLADYRNFAQNLVGAEEADEIAGAQEGGDAAVDIPGDPAGTENGAR